MANTSDPGFRITTHSPEELERFAALFIPTWELPADVTAGPDPGFKAAPMSAATVAALTPEAKPVEAPKPIKATMMGIAMPAPAPAPEPAPAPAPAPDPIVVAPAPVVAPAAPIAPPPAFRPQPVIASSIDDDLEPAPKKKGSMMFAAIGGAVLLIGIGIFALTRGGEEKAKPAETATTTEKKAMDLPEPIPAPIEAKTTEPAAKTAEPTPPPPPKETAAAKAPEPPPKVTAAPPPPPPSKVTAPVLPPPPKATVTAAPKATAAPAKAKPKIKDEF